MSDLHTLRSQPLRSCARVAALALLAALLCGAFVACAGGPGTTANAKAQHVTIGLTFIPNIQFAPFYVAQELGYYRDAGLDVTLRHHGITEGEFDALVSGHEDMIFAGGDETLQARARGIPLTFVATVYTKYPVTLMVPSASPIHSLKDLKGHTIGVPGQFGATYIGLLALLQSAGLQTTDVHIQSIGFTQVPALLGHKVDAAMGYVNNEAVQLQQAGFAIRTFSVADVKPLISNGLAAPQSYLDQHPDIVRAVVKATLRGLEYTLAHPDSALDLSKRDVPGLDDPKKAADAKSVLDATLPVWQIVGGKPGFNDAAEWKGMADFLLAQGQLSKPVDVTTAYSNAYLPSSSS